VNFAQLYEVNASCSAAKLFDGSGCGWEACGRLSAELGGLVMGNP